MALYGRRHVRASVTERHQAENVAETGQNKENLPVKDDTRDIFWTGDRQNVPKAWPAVLHDRLTITDFLENSL